MLNIYLHLNFFFSISFLANTLENIQKMINIYENFSKAILFLTKTVIVAYLMKIYYRGWVILLPSSR